MYLRLLAALACAYLIAMLSACTSGGSNGLDFDPDGTWSGGETDGLPFDIAVSGDGSTISSMQFPTDSTYNLTITQTGARTFTATLTRPDGDGGEYVETMTGTFDTETHFTGTSTSEWTNAEGETTQTEGPFTIEFTKE